MPKKTQTKPGPVKTYTVPLEEIHKRYGRPGECKVDHAVTPDIRGLAQRRAKRRGAGNYDKAGT